MGTLEALASHLAKLLEPLQKGLQEDIRPTLAELGIEFPATLESEAPLKTSLQNTVTKLQSALQALTDLETAIQNNSEAEIIAQVLVLTGDIRAVLLSFGGIASQLDALKNNFPGIPSSAIADFAAKLPGNLFNYLLIQYMGQFRYLPEAIELAGLIRRTEQKVVSADPASDFSFVQSAVHWENISKLISQAGDYFKNLYDWNSPAFDGKKLLQRLNEMFSIGNLPVSYDDINVVLDVLVFEISPKLDVAPRGIVIKLKNPLASGSQSFSGHYWKTDINFDASLQTDTQIIIQPNGNVTVIPPAGGASVAGNMSITWTARHFPEGSTNPFVLLGETGGSRLELAGFIIKTGVALTWQSNSATGEFFIEGDLKGGKLVIDTSNSDGFLQKLLPATKFESDFDISFGFASDKGIYFSGSSALEINLPVHIALGPVSVEGLTIGVKFKDGTIPVSLGADIKASLGPLVAVVQDIGMIATFSFPSNNAGNLGPVQLNMGFKPPGGVGLSIDTGIIKGGGFLYIDVDKGEYVGAMELDFIGIISLKAIGIINTIMPDGSKGFSLLIIITAEFPPIQLGFGFTLNAVGGILGINRTVKIDVLREGVKTNAIKSILFPQDIIANITRIVSDIKQVFPPYPDHFVLGPMAELGWGTPSILTLEIGILLEIPVPRIAILGVIKALIPSEEAALLRIQVNFLGVIDFQNQYISFDASLFDSRLLIYTLAGDMAFRLSWGDNPMFILSVGGFHPAFHDAPADLQHMTRLTISLLSGDNPRISIQSYFAVTSNTVQFGARAELYAAAAGFNVYGFIGYDVLFQFDPFKFIADFSAALALRRGDSVVMGISVSGHLSGPTPFNAKGDASIDFFFFSISVSFNETWGDSDSKDQPEKIDIIPLLTDALKDDRNWKAVIPDYNSLHVSVKKLDLPPDKIVIHPFGVLTFSERLVPLDVTITKFGNKVPEGTNMFTIKETDSSIHTTVTKELFAPANFFEKSDNEKLSSPSFELMNSGFQLTGSADLNMPIGVLRNVDYELSYLHKAKSKLIFAGVYKYAKQLFKSALKGSAASSSKLSFTKNKISANAPDKVIVLPGQYAVANVSDMKLYQSDMVTGSYTEAKQQYDTLIKTHPEMKDQVQILSHFEINMN